MEKRSRPPRGFYKSIETPSIPQVCERKPKILGTFQAERIMARKILNGRPYYMVKWYGYYASQNTWEPRDHLPADLVEAFESPDPDPVRVEEARERIGLISERGMKVRLQYEESIEIRQCGTVPVSQPARKYQSYTVENPRSGPSEGWTFGLHRMHYQRQWKQMPCDSGDFPSVAVKVARVLSRCTEGFPSNRVSAHCIQKELPGRFFSVKKMEEKKPASLEATKFQKSQYQQIPRTVVTLLTYRYPHRAPQDA